MPVDSRPKLTPQEYGRIGARRRWGKPRIVRLDALTPEQRDVVIELVRAQKAANAALGQHVDPGDTPDRPAA